MNALLMFLFIGTSFQYVVPLNFPRSTAKWARNLVNNNNSIISRAYSIPISKIRSYRSKFSWKNFPKLNFGNKSILSPTVKNKLNLYYKRTRLDLIDKNSEALRVFYGSSSNIAKAILNNVENSLDELKSSLLFTQNFSFYRKNVIISKKFGSSINFHQMFSVASKRWKSLNASSVEINRNAMLGFVRNMTIKVKGKINSPLLWDALTRRNISEVQRFWAAEAPSVDPIDEVRVTEAIENSTIPPSVMETSSNKLLDVTELSKKLVDFVNHMKSDRYRNEIATITEEVHTLAKSFPLPGVKPN